MTQICIAAYVQGVVQGVGFRYHTQQQAQALGITGYVCNLDDGNVEIIACGEHDAIERLMFWLKKGGPPNARVDRVLREPRGPSDFKAFTVHY